MSPGLVLSTVGWASTFVLCWLIVLERVAAWPALLFLVFFFLIAAVPSMLMWSAAQEKEDG